MERLQGRLKVAYFTADQVFFKIKKTLIYSSFYY